MMNGIQFSIRGSWAHFKRPETNNNPLTHDLITKTALIGLIGAVLGKSREEMRELFPKYSDGLIYGVAILSSIRKESWSFTMRNSLSNIQDKAPKHIEFLVNPEYLINIALVDILLLDDFTEFERSLKNNEAIYTPVLGLHNCPAELKYISKGEFSKNKGEFETQGFIPKNYKIDIRKITGMRVGFDKIPTFQNNDFWNLPEKYIEVIYPSNNQLLHVANDEYYKYSDDSSWVLV